jgi:predicted transcriptional regulator
MTENEKILSELEELFQELDTAFYIETRKPDDITTEELMIRYKCVKETIRLRMNKLISKGLWKKIKVLDPKDGTIYVYRKVK